MTVVRDLNLWVNSGEVVALLGRNGAGKTTAMLTLAGALRPQSGEIRFLGVPTSRRWAAARGEDWADDR